MLYSFFPKNFWYYTLKFYEFNFPQTQRNQFNFFYRKLFPSITLKENVYILVNSQLSAQHGSTGKGSLTPCENHTVRLGPWPDFLRQEKLLWRAGSQSCPSGQQANRAASLYAELSCHHINVCFCSMCAWL